MGLSRAGKLRVVLLATAMLAVAGAFAYHQFRPADDVVVAVDVTATYCPDLGSTESSECLSLRVSDAEVTVELGGKVVRRGRTGPAGEYRTTIDGSGDVRVVVTSRTFTRPLESRGSATPGGAVSMAFADMLAPIPKP